MQAHKHNEGRFEALIQTHLPCEKSGMFYKDSKIELDIWKCSAAKPKMREGRFYGGIWMTHTQRIPWNEDEDSQRQ